MRGKSGFGQADFAKEPWGDRRHAGLSGGDWGDWTRTRLGEGDAARLDAGRGCPIRIGGREVVEGIGRAAHCYDV